MTVANFIREVACRVSVSVLGFFLLCALVAAIILLGGCATTPPTVVGKVDAVTINKPVAVGCLKAEDIPVLPQPIKVQAGSDTKQKAAAVAIELKGWRVYGQTADAMLKNCAKASP